MTIVSDPNSLTLAGLRYRCAQESDRFFQRQGHDPRYCFELFRRAILHHNERAWELIYAQYQPLVSGWVQRHSSFANSGEEVQYFVNRAFEKMWSVLTPEKFENFPDLKSILRYLQMCVHSVIIDYGRAAERATLLDEGTAASQEALDTLLEKQVLADLQREEFWYWLNQRLQNEKEERVVYGLFILALKPRELFAQFPETFSDVQEVYRTKENLLARLRRDDELEQFLGDA